MIDLSQLLPKLVTSSCDNDEMLETAAKLAFTRVAGAGLRQQVTPFRLYRKTLIVAVADAIWQRQLHHMSGEFVYRINRLLGIDAITSIEFRIDPVSVNENRTAAIPREETQQPIPTEIISAAAAITDSDLRQRFIRAAANCVSRREART